MILAGAFEAAKGYRDALSLLVEYSLGWEGFVDQRACLDQVRLVEVAKGEYLSPLSSRSWVKRLLEGQEVASEVEADEREGLSG